MSKKYYAFTLLCALILSTDTFIHSQIYHSQNQEWKEPPVILKMISVYSRYTPIYQNGMEKFANDVRTISNGQLNIEVYAAGEYKGIEPIDVFDAVSKGTVEIGFGASLYWKAEEIPGSEFMYAVPFGLNAKDMHAWLYRGGGLELWHEIYEPFNVIPFPVGDIGGAMGGWFRKKIEKIEDFKGMKIRMSGLYAKVMRRMGATAKWIPTTNAPGAFDRGEIDAIIGMGPYTDQRYKLHRGPKYYYYPGWQEPCGVLSLIINKNAWDNLPENLKKTIESVCGNTYHFIYNQFENMNSIALKELQKKEEVILKEFPPGVLDVFMRLSKEVLEEEAMRSQQFNKIYQSFKKFKEENKAYGWRGNLYGTVGK